VRGDLYRLRPGKDSAGQEQRGPRYAVAIQSDGILLSTLIVAPTSTSAQAAIFRPEIEMDGTRTRVLVDQMRAVDASRLGDCAGRLDAMETERSTGPSGSCSEFSERPGGTRLGRSAQCPRAAP
jgi:mRNA interferase MazF